MIDPFDNFDDYDESDDYDENDYIDPNHDPLGDWEEWDQDNQEIVHDLNDFKDFVDNSGEKYAKVVISTNSLPHAMHLVRIVRSKNMQVDYKIPNKYDGKSINVVITMHGSKIVRIPEIIEGILEQATNELEDREDGED